jgi:hypothetical protein
MKSMKEFRCWHAEVIRNTYKRPHMYAQTPEQLDLVLWVYHRIGWELDPGQWTFFDDSNDKAYRSASRSTKRYDRDPDGTTRLFQPVIAFWKKHGRHVRKRYS